MMYYEGEKEEEEEEEKKETKKDCDPQQWEKKNEEEIERVIVEKDEKMGVRYFRKAADHGDQVGQLNLSLCCLKRRGIHASHRMAVRYLRMSAQQGGSSSAEAWYFLGMLSLKGIGMELDIETGKYYLRIANEKGSSFAKAKLQEIEEEGE